MRMLLTQARIKELFDYNPETGTVTRKVSTKGAGDCSKGTLVGSVRPDGYLVVMVDGKQYRLHRVIWLWWYGYFPEHYVDHINRTRDDNRLSNLREITHSCNLRNSKVKTNTSIGIPGVSFSRQTGKWLARITRGGETIYLTSCEDLTEAVAHRLAAEQCLSWGDCNSKTPAHEHLANFVKG